jgi:broad-specificity NMP kinase
MNIYIIAGPPGIGKSTGGSKFIPKRTTVIDHDLAAYQYKKKVFLIIKNWGL